jgi:LmbE family N-acetylglucosaminyl deacetylase
MKQFLVICLFLFVNNIQSFGQAPMRQLSAGEIFNDLKKLNVLGSAMYIAAHPDDENTAMLSWLSKEKLVRTVYLSCTRGDGGQNLIGPEQKELMGLIRTHELLEARKVDGPEQYFTRAIDFGFSKTTEETLEIWDKEKVLSDIVWRIRNVRPDIIICRFPPDSRAGHGNHSASAVLAEEAYKAASDPSRFPEQLKYVKVWQVSRLVWNTFNFGATSQKPTDKGSFIQVNVGEFNPLLGKSYTEIAGESRSMHKSQGFGSAKNKGLRPEYLLHKEGTAAQKEIFDGMNFSWSRVKGGYAIKEIIDEILKTYRLDQPELVIPLLMKAHNELSKIDDEYWSVQKKIEIERLIIACAGIFGESNAKDYAVAIGEKFGLNAALVKRSNAKVELLSVTTADQKNEIVENLQNNEIATKSFDVIVPKEAPISQPYWLVEKPAKGIYQVEEQLMRGLPLKQNFFTTTFSLKIEGFPLSITVPVTYKLVDPVKGEIYRPLEIRPEVTATLKEKIFLFTDNKPKKIEVNLKSAKTSAKGKVTIMLPDGWKTEPASITFDLANKYQEQKIEFMVSPTKSNSEGTLKLVVETEVGKYSKGLYTMDYEHIPNLVYFPESEAKITKLDLQIKGKKVGYIAGAGDDVPTALRQMGYDVVLLTEELLNEDLSNFDAIVVGVRAYNTEDRLKFAQKKLMEFVYNGGNMVVQYQTNFRMVTEEIGPYPIKLGRDRVTVEEAPMTFLKPQHVLLNQPNKITEVDFNNWVQERGLYFANTWDSNYETIFSCNDPNEKALEGSTLITKYGKGNYIFTGLSFFRQLPVGVTGAFRLFANMISVGKK